MSNNEKPIVFLSHSSLDKAPLAVLKQILDERTAGSLNFFLSSDGESIKFGRNWVVRVSDALSQAKLMFVFLSSHSAASKWIHFEAGCAYAKDIRVVPVCLPSIDLNQITPPLSLLQGFNLHSHDALENLARICNETFQMKIKESFSLTDFENIVSRISGRGTSYFGDHTGTIGSVQLSTTGDCSQNEFNPIVLLDELCKKAEMNCHSSATNVTPNGYNQTKFISKLELPGCICDFSRQEPKPAKRQIAEGISDNVKTSDSYKLSITLSPELFHINAPLLDSWFEKTSFPNPIYVRIFFRPQIKVESERHQLTTRLYQCGIAALGLTEKDGFKFDGFKFTLSEYSRSALLSFKLEEKLFNKKLSEVVSKLFESQTLWEHQPDLSEMFGQ